jgi:DNA-binding transcriptional ArsR family regulator
MCMSTKETGSTRPSTPRSEEPTTDGVETEASTEDATPAALSLDLIFEILKNQRRREVIRYLREHEQQVTLSDLAEHIAALENDTDVASITSSQRKRVYVGLYQCHLPKMADMGIVQFNQNRGIVALGDRAPQLYQYLDNDAVEDRDWHRYYLGISALGLVVLGASLAGGAAIGVTSALTTAGLCFAVGACATLQAREHRAEETDD